MNLTHEPAAGRLQFQLAYGDTDTVGIAYFSIYYRWMERCYSTWLHAHGIRSGQMVDDLGIVTVGISSGCRYVDTVEVFDVVECQLVADRIGTSSYVVGMEFTRDGELVTKGQMSFAARTPGDFAKTPVPARLLDVIKTLPAPRFDVQV
ncbi:MAG TPA: hotdog domain-containing protein [Nocardioides sp.]|uniref:acyl-CoA thioesterase n=1 Tax=Nocardioides sp. TaxID=35761 RepID=UPI002C61456C|nr:hotdog domain-containing protein [Nocardioides sp.]HTW18274.1 hotdog domain-containing protein [Nocardioides sp.]